MFYFIQKLEHYIEFGFKKYMFQGIEKEYKFIDGVFEIINKYHYLIVKIKLNLLFY